MSESIFMIYLGTVNDPRLRNPTYTESPFVNDRLYAVYEAIRSSCDLDDPVVLGLNSTWSFAQGWRGPGIRSGAKCVNCARIVPEQHDSKYNRRAWRLANPTMPRADQVKCCNCINSLEINGRERPKHLESRAANSHEFMPLERSGRSTPKKCEHRGCKGNTYRFYSPDLKYYCAMHLGRARRYGDMDAEAKKVPKKSKPGRDRPSHCEHDGYTGGIVDMVGGIRQC